MFMEALSFHLCGVKLSLDDLTEQNINCQSTTEKSIFLGNMIDLQYGRVKIYKSKKRMELRLNLRNLINQDKVITFPNEYVSNTVSIKEKISNNEINEYVIDKTRVIFNIQE